MHGTGNGVPAAEMQAQSLRAAAVEHLWRLGVIRSRRVAQAMTKVPRHRFLPATSPIPLERVYQTGDALPFCVRGQEVVSTISAMDVVAIMLEALVVLPGHRVLEIGTGSGYNAALLQELVEPGGEVVSVELDAEVARQAAATLAELGYRAVRVVQEDGSRGYEARAPYDRIIVTASTPWIPRVWFEQLRPAGRLVMPWSTMLWLLALRRTRLALAGHPAGRAVFLPLQVTPEEKGAETPPEAEAPAAGVPGFPPLPAWLKEAEKQKAGVGGETPALVHVRVQATVAPPGQAPWVLAPPPPWSGPEFRALTWVLSR